MQQRKTEGKLKNNRITKGENREKEGKNDHKNAEKKGNIGEIDQKGKIMTQFQEERTIAGVEYTQDLYTELKR